MTDLGSLRLGFAFTLGVFTFFAPCAFPLLPGYVAYFVGSDDGSGAAGDGSAVRTALGAVWVATLASLGFLLVYGALAAVVFAFGARVLANVSLLELLVGTVLVVVGVAMALDRTPSLAHVRLPERRRSPLGFVGFGVVYATAAAGCTGPLFVGVAALAVSAGPVGAALTLGAYAAGMVLLLLVVTVLTAFGRDAAIRRLSASTGRLSRVAGVVLVIAGLVQLYYFLVVFDGLRTLGF